MVTYNKNTYNNSLMIIYESKRLNTKFNELKQFGHQYKILWMFTFHMKIVLNFL
jgi:hypothetical protein